EFGEALLAAGERERAESVAERSLGLVLGMTPRSVDAALAFALRGRLRRCEGRLPEAVADYRAAEEILDERARTLTGSDEERSAFRARHRSVSRELAETLLEMGLAAEAFEAVERSRARALLETFGERELLPAA